MTKLDLSDGWTLHNTTNRNVPAKIDEREIPAAVPGCVHTDLLAEHLIPDPYYGQNELEVQWIGENDWRYRCSFEVAAELLARERLELVCEGLDTVATLVLNGRVIGKTEDMHLAYRFDVKPLLKEGVNDLSVTFRSALAYAHEQIERLGYLPNSSYPHPFNFIRKMACNFGWDWGPTLVTAGIWQPIYLEAWDAARIASVRPLILSANEGNATAEVYAELDGAVAGLELTFALYDPEGKMVTEKRLAAEAQNTVILNVADPQLWWPMGYGAQPLYKLQIDLKQGETVLDTWQRHTGLRQVRLHTDVDDIGSKFVLEVNSKAVFCKGANWIPDDCFLTRVTPERYRERITQALDAGMNMLRVWGGGIYEQRAFYETCDELGIMVWQDFPFACALYPEEEPFGSLIEAEARQQIARLSPHPSLVLWNGTNENLWGFQEWERDGKTWREWARGRTWGAGFYFELLPRLIAKLDPSRPYTPGSPFSGSLELPTDNDSYGTTHVWDVWNTLDYKNYRSYMPRFASEFGFQGPPNFATLEASIPEGERDADSPAMLHHQKAVDGNEKLKRGLARHFTMPENFDDWHFLMQLNQARAVQLGVEWFRAHSGRCMGTLYWQLNDCWPVTSWAAVDGCGRKKLLWHATKHFYADRLLTIQPHGDGLFVHLVNDTDQSWETSVTVRRQDFSGEVWAETEEGVLVEPRSAARVRLALSLTEPKHPITELLVAGADGKRAYWYFARDKQLAYPESEFEAALDETSDGYILTVEAQTFVRDLCLLVDKLETYATTDNQLLTLLPGETGTFHIFTNQSLNLAACIKPGVLCSANPFGLEQMEKPLERTST